jgi:glucosyl-dolichyl phosphate glucuronosyltransferase
MSSSQILPCVTVAISTYNRAELLLQTLSGVVRQDFPYDRYEVLVIDNNSTDDTRRVVQSFAANQPSPRYLLETQQGLSFARNRAIAEMRGDILVLADDDILVERDWLRQLIAPLCHSEGPRVGAVGGEVVPFFPGGVPDWIAGWHAPLAFRADVGPLNENQNPMGANLAIPRWVFETFGAFPTELGRSGANLFGGEETEFLRGLRAAGLEIWFAPAAAVRHQMPASRATFGYASRHAFDSARSRVVAQVKSTKAAGRSPTGYLTSRFAANLGKAAGFALLALGNLLIARTGAAKQALVRAWRACGYLYQIPRSLAGIV